MAAPRLSLAAGLWLAAALTQAQEVPPPAYQLAAYTAGVPSSVLYALALQESGTRLRGRLRPWPWSLNIAGASHRFANRKAACAALLQAIGEVGAKAVDAGLGQINLGWNGQRFQRPCEALDPYRNLQVSAQLLQEHHAQVDDWVAAAGRYHRPAGGEPAARYRASFRRHLAQVLGHAPAPLLADTP